MSVIHKADNLKIRYASHDDYDKVFAINTNVYGGLDYLPEHYHHYIQDPRSKAYVLEIEGEVVSFVFWTFIDEGKTMVMRGLRTKHQHSKKGYTSILRSHGMADCWKEHPEVTGETSLRFIKFDDFTMREAVCKHHDIPYEQIFWHLSITNLPDEYSKTAVLFVDNDQLFNILKDCHHLFPFYIVIDHVPYKYMASNLKLIGEEIKPICFVSQNKNLKSPVKYSGISFGTHVRNDNRLIYKCYFYVESKDDCLLEAHVNSHLKFIKDNMFSIGKELHFLFFYPNGIDFVFQMEKLASEYGVILRRDNEMVVQTKRNFKEDITRITSNLLYQNN